MGRHPRNGFIVPFDQACEDDHPRMGGKCSSLARMMSEGVNVPGGFAVTTQAYAAHLETAGLGERIGHMLARIDVAKIDATEAKSAGIRRAIISNPMPLEIEAQIRAAYGDLSPDGELPVAVRSSATAEDMPSASFAGQQDTYLWIVGADAVVEKVKACWASLFNPQAISYRARNGLGQLDVRMSVGVQKMVDAVAAGVAMTLDPLTGDRSKIVIDSVFGLGEPLVSGEITPDNFVVEKVLLQIVNRRVVEKHHQLVADRQARCTVQRALEPAQRTLSSLSDVEIVAVAQLAKGLEKSMGCPQDVEWAIDRDLPAGENVVALQSRPETVWSRKKAEAAAKTYAIGIEGVLGTLLSPLQAKQ